MKCPVLLFILLCAAPAIGQVTAASCSTSDVQSAINTATQGQTVTIPACTSGVSWTSGVTISGKGIILTGSGSGRNIAGSDSTLTVGNGTKTLTIFSERADGTFPLGPTSGQTLILSELGNRQNFMIGTVTSITGSTLVMNITSNGGSCGNSSSGVSISNCGRWLVSTQCTTCLINNSSSATLFSITEDSAISTIIENLEIDGGTGTSDYIDIVSGGGKAIVVENMRLAMNGNADVAIHVAVNRGVISNISCDSTPFSQAPICVDPQPFDAAAWSTSSFFGMNDTNGQHNLYVETSDFDAYLLFSDNDEGARTVYRDNFLNNAGLGGHGADTGPFGARTFEFYSNVGHFNGYNTGATFPMNQWMYVRGGTFVFDGNTLPVLSSTDYGTKLDINMTVMNLQRNAGTTYTACWGGGTSGGADYYAPHQVGFGCATTGCSTGSGGTGHDGKGNANYSTAPFGLGNQYVGDSEPAYIWGNSRQPLTNVNISDYGSGQGDSCAGTVDTSANYIVASRDYFNGATAKPGYTAYTYPHPLLSPPPTGSIGVLTPIAGMNTNVVGQQVQVFGISGTSWTPGTPGSPSFTISGCPGTSITSQVVVSSGLVDLTVTAGSSPCTATITDPSTAATTAFAIRTPITWYVNSTTGGSRFSFFNPTGQCNGQASTAYVSGTNQPCPYNDPRLMWDDNNLSLSDQKWVSAGGDTTIFQTNGQIAGSDNITPGTGFCAGIGGQCIPPDVPTGTASDPTIFEGANFAACAGAKNFLESIYLQNVGDPAKQVVLTAESTLGTRPFYGLGLAASQHTILRCIDLIGNGGSTTEGIFLGGNAVPLNFDNTLQDFTIEGFADAGIRGNIGGTGPSIHFLRTTFQFNGQSGFNADPGTAPPGTFQLSTGDIVASYAAFFADGCQMEFPVVHPLFPATNCKDDNSPGGGGYGDCFGSQSTPLNASWDHAMAAFCTQDGLDGLHGLNGRTSITNSQAWGSMGATLKAGPGISATYTNNVFIANCHRMSEPIGGNSTFNTNLSDWCRASSQNAMVALPTAVEITGGIESTGTAVVQAGATATHFTTELHIGDTVAVGQFNAVTGKRTITNIADDTHLTISSGFPSDITTPTNLLFLPGGSSTSSSVLTVTHGTFIGYGGTVWDVPCQTGLNIAGVPGQEGVDTSFCAGVTFIYTNNIAQGWGSPNYSAAHMWDALQPTSEDYNLFFGLNTTYGTGAHDINADALFAGEPASPITAEIQLDNFNFSLSSSSPAKAAGTTLVGQTTDFLGNPWDASNPSMGGLQFLTATPTPTSLTVVAQLTFLIILERFASLF